MAGRDRSFPRRALFAHDRRKAGRLVSFACRPTVPCLRSPGSTASPRKAFLRAANMEPPEKIDLVPKPFFLFLLFASFAPLREAIAFCPECLTQRRKDRKGEDQKESNTRHVVAAHVACLGSRSKGHTPTMCGVRLATPLENNFNKLPRRRDYLSAARSCSIQKYRSHSKCPTPTLNHRRPRHFCSQTLENRAPKFKIPTHEHATT